MNILNSFKSMPRRQLIKGSLKLAFFAAFAAACGREKSSVIFAEEKPPQTSFKRLAIVGGGMGGLATAYLCDPDWKIELFESRGKIGGHCDTIALDYRGEQVFVDLGAQFFHPDTHPMYVALLEELGIHNEKDPYHDEVFKAKGSITILALDQQYPCFVSTHPLMNPHRAIDFAVYTRAARKMVMDDGSYEISLDDWVHDLSVTDDFKDGILIPWISAMIGTTMDLAKESSARSILQTYALSFPRNLLQSATTWNSKIGLQGILQRLVYCCQNVNLHKDSPVLHMEKTGGSWYLHTALGRQGPFDHVVINAQPQHSKKWLADLPGGDRLVFLLDRYRYFDARVVIHEDPIYVHKDRRNWSVYIAGMENGSCEGSVWMGGIHGKVQGRTLDLFKSWAYRRKREPSRLLGERFFQHPLITPDVIRAARELRNWQGVEGLWFAGQYTTGMDLQEAALYSAMQVARSLSPRNRNLQSLLVRLAAKGKSGVSYEL